MNLDKKYNLIFVGRLAENKGIRLLLKVAKKTGLKLLIIGDGPLKKYVEDFIEESGSTNISYYGWAKNSLEIAKLINESEILVMLSNNEGGPRVILESMACGVPVVATAVGIVPDVVSDPRTGLVTDWSLKDISQKISKLMSNPDLYNEFRENGLKLVRKFEKKEAIKNYADKLKEELIK